MRQKTRKTEGGIGRLLAGLAAATVIAAAPASAGQASADIRELVLDVYGMACSSCSAAVEKTLGSISGVDAARADLRKDRVTVRYDAAKVTPRQFEEALRKAGFRARPAEKQAPRGQPVPRRDAPR